MHLILKLEENRIAGNKKNINYKIRLFQGMKQELEKNIKKITKPKIFLQNELQSIHYYPN